MKKIKIILLLLLLPFILLLTSQKIFADEYFYEPNIRDRLFEKVYSFFKFSSTDKINFQTQIIDKRLGELKYVIAKNKGDKIEETSSRYETNVNKLQQFYQDNKSAANKDALKEKVKIHEDVLVELQKGFEYESGFWLLLQHDINTIKNFSAELQKS